MAKAKSVVQRQTDPLPPGRYWITVLDEPETQFEDFDEWHSSTKLVDIETTSTDVDANPKSMFVIFRVKEPGAFFDATKFGFPNTAPPSITNVQDVEGVPTDAGQSDGIEGALKFAKSAGKVAAALFIAKLVVDLFKSGK